MDSAGGTEDYPAHRYRASDTNDPGVWRVERGIKAAAKSSAGKRAENSAYTFLVALDANRAISYFGGDGVEK
jgi:hypothetical protein